MFHFESTLCRSFLSAHHQLRPPDRALQNAATDRLGFDHLTVNIIDTARILKYRSNLAQA